MSQKLDDRQLNEIVDTVLDKVRAQISGTATSGGAQEATSLPANVSPTAPVESRKGGGAAPAVIVGRRRGIFDVFDTALSGARAAFEQ